MNPPFLLHDHLGNTRVVLDEQGNTKAYYDYFPFGKIQRAYVAGTDARYKFTGKEFDNEDGIGLYYSGARYYDPEIGRWFVTDPAGQFSSPYVYSGNSPMLLVDANGEFAIVPILVMAAWQGFVNYQITGDVGSSFKAAGISALSGAAGQFASSFAPAGVLPGAGYGGVTGGVIGGVTSKLSGGSFGSGFAIGAFSGGVFGAASGYSSAVAKGANMWTGSGGNAGGGGLTPRGLHEQPGSSPGIGYRQGDALLGDNMIVTDKNNNYPQVFPINVGASGQLARPAALGSAVGLIAAINSTRSAFANNEHYYRARTGMRSRVYRSGTMRWQRFRSFMKGAGTRGGIAGGMISGVSTYYETGNIYAGFRAAGIGSLSGTGGAALGAWAGTAIGGPVGTVVGFGVGYGVSELSYLLLDSGLNTIGY